MGNHLDNLHIEFFGMPGSGKSTVSHEVAIKLIEQGYEVREPSHIIDNKNSKTIRLIKKAYYTLLLSLFNHEQYKKTKKTLKKNDYLGLSNTKQLLNIAYKEYMYLHAKDRCIYIWDQGLVQSSISMSTYSKIDAVDNYKYLANESNVQQVYLRVPKDENYKRLKERNKHNSRFEKTTANKKEELYNRISACCENICNNNTIIVDNKDIPNSVEYIIEKLNIKK